MTSPLSSAAASSNGTSPHTILSAVDACRERCVSVNAVPIDLLAVVVRIESTEKLVRLWMHDASLPPGRRAQILFFGKRKRDAIVDDLMIRPGDVVRFNRIDLRKDQDGPPEIFVFWHAVQDPEAGAEFFRICRVDGFTGQQIDFSLDIAVPHSMETNQARLDELISWYRSSEYFGHSASLQPLPCQRRSLAEFQACLGVVGHVVAYVIQVEQCGTVAKRGKRKKAQATAADPTSIFATLTDDDSATLTTFYLDNSVPEHQRFQKVLQRARDEKRPVRLSRVSAKSASRLLLQSSNIQNDEILLVPASDSDVALADSDEMDQIVSRLKNAPTQTQECMPMANVAPSGKEVLDRRSPILDITVKGVSLAHQLSAKFFDNMGTESSNLYHLFQFPRAGGSFTSSSSLYEYSSATITLRDRELGATAFNVEANGTIVKLLCGGLELDEWSPTRCVEHGSSPAYNRLVLDVLRGLLTESVELWWEIERIVNHSGRTSYRVLGVSLPEL